MLDCKNILIYAEMNGDAVAPATWELVSFARKAAEGLGQAVSALVFGTPSPKVTEDLGNRGVDEIFQVSHPLIREYHPLVYIQAMTQAWEKIRPKAFFLAHNSRSQDVAPGLATKINAVCFPNCTHVRIGEDGGTVIYGRPTYGGKAAGEFACPEVPQVATFRPKSAPAAEKIRSAGGKTSEIQVELEDPSAKLIIVATKREEQVGIKLEDAKAVVCGGGGIGQAAGFQTLKDLAALLNGAVGVTRVPCDEGWMPISLEIGQSGKIVSPKIYIGIGVSGAPQHIAGCAGSKTIVAINRDPDAPIFRISDFGAVGDYREIVPLLVEELKKSLKK